MTREERENLIKHLKYSHSIGADYVITDKEADEIIKALEQEPKTGHWIEQDGFDGDTYYDCSDCGESFCLIDGTPTDNLYNHCPNCGAKMIEPREKYCDRNICVSNEYNGIGCEECEVTKSREPQESEDKE